MSNWFDCRDACDALEHDGSSDWSIACIENHEDNMKAQEAFNALDRATVEYANGYEHMTVGAIEGAWIGLSTSKQMSWCSEFGIDPESHPECYPFPGEWHGDCKSSYTDWVTASWVGRITGEPNNYPHKVSAHGTVGESCVEMSRVIGGVPTEPKWNDELCSEHLHCTCSRD